MNRASPALRGLVSVALALAMTGPVASAAFGQTRTATGSADAASAAERAKALYREGKFVEALLEFKKAYELQPTSALSYNIARCYEQLSQWDESIAAYERFMTETTNPRERSEAADKIEFLKSKVSSDQNSPEARYKARIEGGKKAFSRGDYDAAIQEFKAAFDIKPSGAVLFNIAKSFERMSRYEEAIDYYQQYLDLDPNATDRPDVEEQIRRLKKSIRERFQELSVSSEPPGADIYLDDRNTGLQGQTNFRFKVQPGPHTIFLDANGFEPVKREFVMPDDKPLALEFNMKKLENVGFLEISVNVDGARIFIDGAIVGLSPYKQKKALTEGAHQVTIEAAKYPRYTQDFSIIREQTLNLPIMLEEYSEPIRDETLEKWGRNLMLIGFIGGGLGFAGPFAYQKAIIRRDLLSALGPSQVAFGAGVTKPTYWQGSPKDASGKTKTGFTDADYNDNFKANGTVGTLQTIQTVSVIVGGSLAAVGLGLYVFKWVRTTDKKEVITADLDPDGEREVLTQPPIEITSFGVAPTSEGANVGLSASF